MRRGGALFSAEKRFLDWILRHKDVLLIIAVSLLAIAIRYTGRNFDSGDYSAFLKPWYEEVRDLGASALGQQVGEYNISYQTLIYIGTLLPIEPMYWYKLTSCIFDFLLAIEVGLIVIQFTQHFTLAALGYALTLLIPSVIIDSAFWAQCDSIFSFFVLASLRRLFKGDTAFAMLLYGAAIAFKLQAVFILPFFLLYYLTQRKFSILYFLLVVVGFYVLCLPGIIAGRSILDPIAIYTTQTGLYDRMTLAAPTVWMIFTSAPYAAFKNFAILLTIGVLLVGYVVFYQRRATASRADLMLVAAWTVWTCFVFLPAMHERYFYIAGVLLFTGAFVKRSPLVFAMWMLAEALQLISYTNFLFQATFDPIAIASWMVCDWLLLGYLIVFHNTALRKLERRCLAEKNALHMAHETPKARDDECAKLGKHPC